MCAGFFLIAALEEAIHHLLHPASTSKTKEEAEAKVETMEEAKEEVREDQREHEEERSAARAKAAIRSVFVVFALSFHSIVEGEQRHTDITLQLNLDIFFMHINRSNIKVKNMFILLMFPPIPDV